ncbi:MULTISPECIES: TrlF family AAA-like ATPase [Dehalococcoides]|uniref:AAA family ATPase n=1 Tax=Dehalococcoides mccartyi TaxID=61435 RepID=A0AB38Z9B2_9CHLR|nr:AAA family ATPase [Dehalococcoides mccartyi]AHB14109.1 hypothetical protein GY50_1338 [Dehalococcoides mccartyi GY50]APH13016.1 hypothetical protein ASJ33_07540 [Dehalococcoides mccartyi]WRO07204.1 AAA family ATPase [Dehalococcoides mccartyi]
MTTDFQGLRWKKIDLHFHSPGSGDDYQERGATPEMIISRAKKHGLDALAVTDHNTGIWIDSLKTAARGSGIVVFPGVEITVMGGERNVHVLAIFDPSKGMAHVHDFLAQIDITEEKRGRKDALATGDVNQVINKITEAEGVALLAHCDSSSGVVKEMKGQARISIIRNQNLLGAEITKDETMAFFDGEDPNYQRKLACIKCSDSHSLREIGSKSSYFKIGTMSIGALRQCFYDPQTRIRIIDPPNVQCPMVLDLHVDKGFFNGLRAKFHPGMNAILGGKGVGKSLVVEFVRFALNQPSYVHDIQTDLKSKLENQLGLGGKITIHVKTASGINYIVERQFDGDTNPIQVTDSSDGSAFQGDITKVFPILAYSQNEVIDISRDTGIQLRSIDRLVDLDTLRRPIQEAQDNLASNVEEYISSLLAKDKVQELDASIATINAQIKELDNMLADPMYKEGKDWNNKVALINLVNAASQKLRQQIEQSVNPESVPAVPGLPDGEQDTDLKGYRDKVSAAADSLVSNVKVSLKAFDDALLLAQKDRSEFDKRKGEWDKKFEAFLKTAGGQQEALSKQRKGLAENLDNIVSQRDEFNLKASFFETHRVKRETLLDTLDKARQDLFVARSNIYEDLTKKSDERLQLTLEQNGNRQAFIEGLTEITRGLSIGQKFKEQLVKNMMPREFVAAVLRKDKTELETKGLLTAAASSKIVDSIIGNETLLRQLLSIPYECLPEDVPNIQYRKEDEQYYPLTQLSVGQKCTALLLIALSEGSMPIIIDQPEDALDVATVYHDIVQRLRQRKDQRQFVITTHNSNVAVSSDSDMFHILKGTATSGEIVCAGAIDLELVARQVVDHLEGGVEPYKLRGRKYNVR